MRVACCLRYRVLSANVRRNGVRELYTRAQFQAVLEYQQVTPWNHQSRGRKNLCSVVHPGLGRDCQQCATCHFCRHADAPHA